MKLGEENFHIQYTHLWIPTLEEPKPQKENVRRILFKIIKIEKLCSFTRSCHIDRVMGLYIKK